MNVLLLTVFLSVLLAALFLLFFIQERRSQKRYLSSPEQDSLRPFDIETPTKAKRR